MKLKNFFIKITKFIVSKFKIVIFLSVLTSIILFLYLFFFRQINNSNINFLRRGLSIQQIYLDSINKVEQDIKNNLNYFNK